MKINFSPANENDIKIITSQIGRTPRGVKGVAWRCPHKFPQVIVSEPVFWDVDKQEDIFFPTTYWLSCCHLRDEVSKLESGGLISRLEEVFKKNVDLRELLIEAHAFYIHQRFNLVGREQFLQMVSANHPWLKRILQVGIAGIADYRHLKCLHAHVAQQLAIPNNPAGEMTLRLIAQPFCSPDNVRCKQMAAELNLSLTTF